MMLHVLCQMSAAFAERRSLPAAGFFLMLGTVGWRVSLDFDLLTSLQPCVDGTGRKSLLSNRSDRCSGSTSD